MVRVRNCESGARPVESLADVRQSVPDSNPRRNVGENEDIHALSRRIRALMHKNMNAGVWLGLFEHKHYARMGDAIWLFGWLVGRQTRRNGLILGGAPMTYERITTDTGIPTRTLRRWMATLKAEGYIEISYLNFKQMRIRICNPKKFSARQLGLKMKEEPSATSGLYENGETAKSGRYDEEPSANSGRSVRPEVAGTPAKSGRFKQSSRLSSNERPESGQDGREAPVKSPESGDALSRLSLRELKGLETTLNRSLRDHRIPAQLRRSFESQLGEVHEHMKRLGA